MHRGDLVGEVEWVDHLFAGMRARGRDRLVVHVAEEHDDFGGAVGEEFGVIGTGFDPAAAVVTLGRFMRVAGRTCDKEECGGRGGQSSVTFHLASVSASG